MTVVGIDVGGKKKGFHACAIDGREIVAGPTQLTDVDTAVAWVRKFTPTTVALDSPFEPAPEGTRSREDEKTLNRAVCRIRWTPDQAGLEGKPYFAWILHGLELYEALRTAIPGAERIEVFPTAAWTEWIGPRKKKRRAAWTTAGMETLGNSALDLDDLDSKTGKSTLNQDDRDAIAAALVARQYEAGETTAYGKIIVPAGALP
jgi:predicted nuclease with RNAse H fold